MDAALSLMMRWLHVASVAVLLGGVFYARVVIGEMAPGFKPLAYGSIGAILISGLYNFLTKSSIPAHYYVWLGIKILLALHVFTVTILYRGNKPRALTGVLIMGGAALALGTWLRWISLP
jgi:hypothetical protein